MFVNKNIPTQAEGQVPDTICAICETIKPKGTLVHLNYSDIPVWALIGSTGKIVCPNCFVKALQEECELINEPLPQKLLEIIEKERKPYNE